MEQIPAGTIVTAHGIRGEVRILPGETDAAFLRRLPALYLDGRRLPVSIRVHKGMAVAKFPGVDDRDAALALRGKAVSFAREDAELPPDGHFDCELVGMEVFDGETGDRLGIIEKVEAYPASKVYTVRGERTYLVPAVPGAFILSVDLEANRMDIRRWAGLATDEA